MQIVGLWALLLVLFQTDAVTQDAPVPRFEYTPSLGCGDVFFHARNSAEAEILRIEVDVAQARRSAPEQVFDLAALPTDVGWVHWGRGLAVRTDEWGPCPSHTPGRASSAGKRADVYAELCGLTALEPTPRVHLGAALRPRVAPSGALPMPKRRQACHAQRLLAAGLLSLAVIESSGAQPGLQRSVVDGRRAAGSWSATSSTGLALTGTWTAAADPAAGTVTGTWTLVDAKGRTVRRGGWSAAKSAAGWTGTWRAAVSGRQTEYSGAWSASVDLNANLGLTDLFEKAALTVVSGRWRAGRHSGAWSIRAGS